MNKWVNRKQSKAAFNEAYSQIFGITMRTSQRKRTGSDGNAYLMVLIISMLLTLMVSIALLVTIRSRQITAQYTYFTGLYDIGVAGKEDILFVLRRGLSQNRAVITHRAGARMDALILAGEPFDRREILFHEAALILIEELGIYFQPHHLGYRHHWAFDAEFTLDTGTVVHRNHHGHTTVRQAGNTFHIETTIYAATGGIDTHPARLSAYIVWVRHSAAPDTEIVENLENYIDYYTLEMVELMRVT